jgi:hypothetical protein
MELLESSSVRPRQARYQAALPGDLERQIEAFIEHYNHRRTLHSPGHG